MVDQEAVRRQVAAGLRRARQRASLTQAKLAEALALSTSAVRHLEAARHSIRIEQLPALAYALGCTVRELLAHMRLVRDAQAQAQERRTPGQHAGQFGGGSAMGERSTASDPHGDASHAEHSAEQKPPASESSPLPRAGDTGIQPQLRGPVVCEGRGWGKHE